MTKGFYDRRHGKSYTLITTQKFLDKFGLNLEQLKIDIEHYLKKHYFVKKEQFIQCHLSEGNTVGFHKIEISINSKPRRKGGRCLTFFIVPEDEEGFVIPCFAFPVKKEDKYTTAHMKRAVFGRKLQKEIEKIQSSKEKIREIVYKEQ